MWTELVRQAMAVERPFTWSVMLWRRRSAETDGAGQWRIEFGREDAGTIDWPNPYVLVNGVLTKRA